MAKLLILATIVALALATEGVRIGENSPLSGVFPIIDDNECKEIIDGAIAQLKHMAYNNPKRFADMFHLCEEFKVAAKIPIFFDSLLQVFLLKANYDRCAAVAICSGLRNNNRNYCAGAAIAAIYVDLVHQLGGGTECININNVIHLISLIPAIIL